MLSQKYIRLLLIVCLITTAFHYLMIMNKKTNVIIGSSNSERYYAFGYILFFNIWVVIGTGIALILEFVMDIYYCNSCHVIFEILDIIRYSLLALCLLLGFVGYAIHIAVAISDANSCERYSKSDGKLDTACKELRYLAIEFTLYAIPCGVTLVIIGLSALQKIAVFCKSYIMRFIGWQKKQYELI